MRRIRLTGRGAGLAVTGLIFAIIAAAAGLEPLMWPAGLLFGLVASGVGVALLGTHDVTAERRLLPPKVPAGSPVVVEVELTRTGIGMGSLNVVEEQGSGTLAGLPILVFPTGWGWPPTSRSYTLTPLLRGRHHLGPGLWRVTDVLGLASAARRLGAVRTLTVTPAVHPLSPVQHGSGVGLVGQLAHRSNSLLGADDALIREYRPRDDVRRIHWRSTARSGTLMVRREEQAWEPSAMLLLDSRAGTHLGEGLSSTFEWAVSAVASIAVHLIDAGFSVELVDAAGRRLGPAGSGSARSEEVLEHLTDADLTRATTLEAGLATVAGNSGHLLIAVLGQLSMADAVALTSAHRNRGTCWAVVLRGADDPAGVDEAAAVLLADGWQVFCHAYPRRVAEVWAALDGGGRP